MGFSDLLKKMFGSKADRDLKEIRPILNKALAAYEKIDKMSDDELRAEAQRIRKVIADRIADELSPDNCRAYEKSSRQKQQFQRKLHKIPVKARQYT